MDDYKTPEARLEFDDDGDIDSSGLTYAKRFWALFWRFFVSVYLLMIVTNGIFYVVLNIYADFDLKLKPTFFGCANAALLLLISLVHRKGLAHLIFGGRIGFNSKIWIRFNFCLILISLLMALTNFAASSFFANEDLVRFKLFGSTLIGISLITISIIYSLKARKPA